MITMIFRLCILSMAVLTASSLVPAEEIRPYWIFFKDKGNVSIQRLGKHKNTFNKRALERRKGRFDSTDLPPFKPYVDSIESLGLRIKNTSKWLNAISVYMPESKIAMVEALSFVKKTKPVGTHRRPKPSMPLKKISQKDSVRTIWGALYESMDLLSIPFAHDYISAKTGEEPGSGIRVAFFDTGFDLAHPALKRMMDSSLFVADSDFVSNDGSVDIDTHIVVDTINVGDSINPIDSVTIDTLVDNAGIVGHGTATVSLLAGYAPHTFLGAAYNAEFVLARTEQTLDEHHTEEDNWASALEWAESLGVDIVNSSLGYRYGFDAPDTSYTADDMDGQTAIVSRAAAHGISRGLVIVNSMGNEGPGPASLSAPADVDSLIGVGATYNDGTIADLSSRGPTADGRIKPDVVAPGISIIAADAASQGFRYLSGTSLSAPLTTGCAVLLKQMNNTLTNTDIVKKFHATSSRHDRPDNSYGWGIVDALAAALDSFSVFGGVFDSSSFEPLDNAIVILESSQDTITPSRSGLYFFENISAGAQSIIVKCIGWYPETLNVDIPSYPSARKDILLKSATDTTWVRGIITHADTSTGAAGIDGAEVRWTGPVSGNVITDASGGFLITGLSRGAYQLSIRKEGYKSISINMDVPQDSILQITLSHIDFKELAVYPIPCRRPRITFEFYNKNLIDSIRDLTVDFYTIDGYKIKTIKQSGILDRSLVKFSVDLATANGQRFRSGIYYVFITFGGDTKKLKIPIINDG